MFGAFFAYRNRPLPDFAPLRAQLAGARDLPIDVTDKRSPEPLIALTTKGVKGRNYYASVRNPPYWQKAEGAVDELWARASVVDKLAAVNACVAEMGLRLHVFDAWRPLAVQSFFHDAWTPAALRERRPDLSEKEIAERVGKYWARPSADPLRPSPHSTGAAVDLTLAWEDGEPLYMGGLFDDPSAISNTDHFERQTDADFSFSAEEARANRRLLYWVMADAGFANYPEEWWHFSYGDQMWAALTGQGTALYGAAAPLQ